MQCRTCCGKSQSINLLINFFEEDKLTALQSIEKAQWIAFAPAVFQTTRVLRDTGILQLIQQHADGLTQEQVVEKTNVSKYGVRVLMEAALGIGLLTCKEGIYKGTKTATFILNDKLTQVNFDFMNDVCYQGLFTLDKSIENGKPEGLKVFGDWPTLYRALAHFPPKVRESWLAFDHYYSDASFADVLPIVFKHKPKSLLDIGGNTGKWALECFQHDPDVIVTIFDLPGQVNMANKNITARGFGDRIRFHESDILVESLPFPKGFDAIWMSQFLDCFSDEQIISILKRCRQALNPGGSVYILEPFWDCQRFQVGAFALQQTSIYFTAMANGNSQMYHSDIFKGFIKEAGFEVAEQKDMLGVGNTLLVCKPV